MDSKQFLKDMLETGRRDGDKPISKTIGKVKFELGYSGFAKGHSMASLFRSYQEPSKSTETKAAVIAHIKNLGGQSAAYLGIKYEIPATNVISFDAQYDKAHFVQAENEEADFSKILDAISELDIPLNEWVWVAYNSIDSPTAVAKGEDGKFETPDGERKYRKIVVPVEKFADETAARAAVGGSGNGGSTAADNSQWSNTALGNDYPNGIPEKDQIEISEWFGKMVKGTAFANDPEGFPLPYENSDPEAAKKLKVKRFLAEMYRIETADIDIVLDLHIPF